MADEIKGDERRQFPRADAEFAVFFNLALPIPVNMDADSQEYPAVALDVSEGGIGLDVNQALAVETPVKLRFELINSTTTVDSYRRQFFKLDGQIRYCTALKRQHFHIGVQFLGITPEERDFIAVYIKDLKLKES